MASQPAHISFAESLRKAKQLGFGDFLEIVAELSQESTKKGLISRKDKEFIILGIALSKSCSRCIEIHSEDSLRQGATDEDIALVKRIALHTTSTVGQDNRLWPSWKASWSELSMSRGSIARRHREMIGLAIAIIKHDGVLIDYHTKMAMSSGATAEEVFEVMPIALLMEGTPALSQLPNLIVAINESQDQRIACKTVDRTVISEPANQSMRPSSVSATA